MARVYPVQLILTITKILLQDSLLNLIFLIERNCLAAFLICGEDGRTEPNMCTKAAKRLTGIIYLLWTHQPRISAHHHLVIITGPRSEEHTSELQSQSNLVCRLLLEKKNK